MGPAKKRNKNDGSFARPPLKTTTFGVLAVIFVSFLCRASTPPNSTERPGILENKLPIPKLLAFPRNHNGLSKLNSMLG
jgi:hypothetical protein